ncbi:methyltransferase domain-containing protein [Algoriphagus mannitolivorans]|uniref:hypothetical protein n=1 Tax=Algoriphagus mannitolivorans TaxID=226504 RepID=UPI0003FA12CF|nr:hypothetical protein [Algoriphagus mannitolivorans]
MEGKKIYRRNFYTYRNRETEYSAKMVLDVLFSYYHPFSMVDFGCGVGTWLKVGQEKGVHKVLGLEGEWLNKEHLVIDPNDFMYANLQSKINLPDTFDLGISLEVAEHIEEKYADIFIENLVNSSQVILFSAAIPGQRGSGHVNEQWPEYWISKFKCHDFIPIDLIRPRIWDNEKIKTWYKQNIILFCHKDKLKDLPELNSLVATDKKNWSIVHPSTFKRQIEISHPKYSRLSDLITSIPKVFFNSIKSTAKKLLRS